MNRSVASGLWLLTLTLCYSAHIFTTLTILTLLLSILIRYRDAILADGLSVFDLSDVLSMYSSSSYFFWFFFGGNKQKTTSSAFSFSYYLSSSIRAQTQIYLFSLTGNARSLLFFSIVGVEWVVVFLAPCQKTK